MCSVDQSVEVQCLCEEKSLDCRSLQEHWGCLRSLEEAVLVNFSAKTPSHLMLWKADICAGILTGRLCKCANTQIHNKVWMHLCSLKPQVYSSIMKPRMPLFLVEAINIGLICQEGSVWIAWIANVRLTQNASRLNSSLSDSSVAFKLLRNA